MVKHGGKFLQIMKLNPKMGFWSAKHGLSKHGLKRPNWSPIWGRAQKRMGEGEEKKKEKRRRRRRREEEEEEIKQKGMETEPKYGSMEF